MADVCTQVQTALSLYEEGLKEAQRHKWIESQKRGLDLGERALHEWYRLHWWRYCRRKRLEHLLGERCWREFADENFSRLYTLILEGDVLVDRILDRVDVGLENLEILNWALDWGLPMNRVLDILAQIDINRARLEPHGTGTTPSI